MPHRLLPVRSRLPTESTGQGLPEPGAGAGNATTRPLGCADSGPATALSGPGQAMRERISRLGADHLALAAMWKAPFVEYDAGFGHVRADVLIITGERDNDFGDPAALAARLPAAWASRPPADHASTMNHPMFAAKLIAHLTAHRA